MDAAADKYRVAAESNCWMCALFDNEEVGSNTAQGGGRR